jgi:hypothetical protein
MECKGFIMIQLITVQTIAINVVSRMVLRMKILVGTLEDYDALVRVAKVFELLADRVAELVGSANQIDGRV